VKRGEKVKLTKNFSTKELECECGCGFGSKREDYDPRLLTMLQKVRDKWGKPIYDWQLSCCRCPTHNIEVGGVPGSKHAKNPCEACDIAFNRDERDDFIEMVLQMHENGELDELGGIGYQRYTNGCVHLDTYHADDGHLRRW